MLNKFFLTLIGLVIAVFAICNLNFNQENTVENFWGTPGFTWKTELGVAEGKQKHHNGCNQLYGVPDNLSHINWPTMSRPSFQGILSPRFMSEGYRGHVKYNMPDEQYQAVPCEPLTFGQMANEGYSSGCGSGSCSGGCAPSCGRGGIAKNIPSDSGYPLPSDFAAGDYNSVLDKAQNQHVTMPTVTDTLPLGTMSTVNANGDVTQPVVYQRFVYANRNSRLRSQGDPIRGDLPVVPCKYGMFDVYPNVNIDLQEGALSVMGGLRNTSGQALAKLINEAQPGYTTISGVNLADMNMTPGMDIGSQGGLMLNDAVEVTMQP